jgi:uncharacterized membrane protein
MNTMFTTGRIFYAVAVISLGIEHLIRGNFSVALLPFPAAFPGRTVLALAVGIAFLLAGLCIITLWKARSAAFWLGAFFLLLVLYPHVPILVTNLYNGGAWTVLTELTAFSGGAFYLAGTLPQPLPTTLENRFNPAVAGRWLFAVSFLIFAIQHFIYARYIATLIPLWIPAQLFWAYFVGVAFTATAVSLLINRQRKLATGLLGVLFLLWVVLLHAPRVVTHPRSEPEWTSLFVALAMSGISFIMAGSSNRKSVARADSAPVHSGTL